MRRPQHHKGKKRPRAWHRGRQQSRLNDRALRLAEPVFARAELERARTATEAEMSRQEVADWNRLLAQLGHVSPAVLDPHTTCALAPSPLAGERPKKHPTEGGSVENHLPRSQRGLFGSLALWVIGLVLLTLAITSGLWALGVFSSDVRGAGDAIKQRNSGLNRVQSQARFEDLAAEYDASLANIAAYGTPTTAMQKTELRGLQQHCVQVARQFNAESRKYTARVWKSAGLPPTLDLLGCNPT